MKKIYSGFILVGLIVCLWQASGCAQDNMTLTEQLAAKASASKNHVPSENQTIMARAIQDLRASGIEQIALKKGDKMPPFILPAANGEEVSSSALLKEGPLVVTFYRGGWCPYCNLQLHDLEKHLPEILAAGAQLVAISPQTPDETLSTVQKEALEFYVLSDTDGQVAHKFGLMYKLPPELVEVYKEFGIDLEKVNGNDRWELPLAATYVVSSEGEVVYSFVNADYKKRAETLAIIEVLKNMSYIEK